MMSHLRFLVLLSLVLACASCVRPLEVRESVADCAQRDDDNDLVDNCHDKCPNSKPNERIAPDGCPAQVTIESSISGESRGILFKSGGADLELNTRNLEILNSSIGFAKQYPHLPVEIRGHTDQCPGQNHVALSQRRADAVAEYLRKNGFSTNQIRVVKGYGDEFPEDPSSKELPACRVERNDRVNIVFVTSGGNQQVTFLPEARVRPSDCAQGDGDKDGVDDCNDKCPNSKAGEAIGPDGCVSVCGVGSVQAQSITFGNDAVLTNEQQTYLKYELSQLQRNPALKLELVGHSDRCETPKRAVEIGLARANAVKDWFVRNGLDATRIVKIRSAGSSEPAVPTSDRRPDCDVQANRRVDRNVRY